MTQALYCPRLLCRLCEVGTNEITIILAYRFIALPEMVISLSLFMASIIAHLARNSDRTSVNWQWLF